MMNYDAAVIGGGPGGYTAAEASAQAGLRTVLFEKNLIGGTCLNRGCIPTKAYLHSAETWAVVSRGEIAGIKAGSFDFSAMSRKKDETVSYLRQGVEGRLKAAGVTVIRGTAQITNPGEVLCDGEIYAASNTIIAAGASAVRPPVPGIDLTGVYTSDDLLEGTPPEFDSLIIIGGGVIGVEMASIFLPLGKSVTILEMAARILPEMDPEISRRLALILKKQGAGIETSASVTAITGSPGQMQVTYTDKKRREHTVTAGGVLAATGRRASLSALFPTAYCPQLDRGAAVADADGQTSLPGVYVIGDARAGNIQLAHVAEAQGKNVAAILSGKKPSVDETVVPACVYCRPAAASVGLTQDGAKAAEYTVRTLKALTGANGKCVIEGTESGFLKIVADSDTGIILGAQMVCPEAPDLIGEMAVCVQKKLTVAELAAVIHPHPAFCELISSAASAW